LDFVLKGEPDSNPEHIETLFYKLRSIVRMFPWKLQTTADLYDPSAVTFLYNDDILLFSQNLKQLI
jgi:hypothetical protein